MECHCCVVDLRSVRWSIREELGASIAAFRVRRHFFRPGPAGFVALAALFLFQLVAHFSYVNGQNEAFIQTNTELRYLVDGIPVHLQSAAISEEPSAFTFADLEEESYQFFPSHIKFHPPSLDFGEQPLGIPRVERILLENLSEDTNIQMLSISSSTVHFHCSFFQDKFVSALGNTSFDVVFLGRTEGLVESSLFIHTSVGSFKYQLKATGTPNPYGLRPLVGVRMPLNSSFSPAIELHNPHSETLQVTEMYSSGGDLHLELPSGNSEGPRALWEVPPYETKRVMKANFVARSENNHTAYIRIKTNSTATLDLIVPVEVEVSSQPGIYCPQEVLDFGVLRSDQDVVTLPLYLLVSSHKPISVQNVLVTPVNEAVNITFEPKRVSPDTSSGIVIAQVSFDPSKVTNDKQLSGKIVVKSKNNQFKVTVPYRARLLQGRLRYNSEILYFLADGGRTKGTNYSRGFDVTNEFLVPIHVRNVTMDANLGDHFSMRSLLPFTLKPNESRVAFDLTMKNASADLQLSGHIWLLTNVSDFRLEVLCYNGRLVPFLGSEFSENLVEEGIDFGTMGVGEKRDVRFALKNDNPIEVRIRAWGSNMSLSYVELLGSQRTSALEFFQLQDLPLLPKTLIIKPHHFILFRVGILKAPEQEALYKAHVFVLTAYQELIIPFRLRTAKGSLTIPGGEKVIQLGDSFPGMLTEKTVRVHSTFRHELILDQFSAVPPDGRFSFQPTEQDKESSEIRSPALQAGEVSQVGRLLFDPGALCRPSCYSSLALQSKVGQEWLSALVQPPSLTDLDVFLFSSMREKYEKETLPSRVTNFTFQLDTNEVKGFLFRAQTRLIWPEVVLKDRIVFPVTQMGNVSYADVSITNPSSSPLVVQAFLVPTSAESSYASLRKILQRLRNWFSYVDDFGSSLPAVNTTEDGDEEGLSAVDDIDLSLRYAAESFSFIDLDSDLGGGKGRKTEAQSVSVQRINDLPNVNDTLSVVVQPGANLTLRLFFSPKVEAAHESLLVVRNNLTVLDLVFLRGTGGQGHLRFGNRKPGSSMPLLFDIAVKHLKDCDKPKSQTTGPPNLTVKRSFTARNTGSLPIYVSGFFIEGSECEGYGFRVMNCKPGFTLLPNGTHKVDIAFTPDFTLTRVQRMLFMETSIAGGPLNFTMVATLPPQSLAPCWTALPRPSWEWILAYVSLVAMIFFLVCVLLAAFFEADRILKFTFVTAGDECVQPTCTAKALLVEEEKQQKFVMKPFNLKEIAKQGAEEVEKVNGTTVRKRTVVAMNGTANGITVKSGKHEDKHGTNVSHRKNKSYFWFLSYFWSDSNSHKEEEKSEEKPVVVPKEPISRTSSTNSNVSSKPRSSSTTTTTTTTTTASTSTNNSPAPSTVTKHSIGVETDRLLEAENNNNNNNGGKVQQKPVVPEKGRKARRRARLLADQRRKELANKDEDSSSTTTDNNSMMDDEFDRDCPSKTPDKTIPVKEKKDKNSSVKDHPLSDSTMTTSNNKPKQKVEPYKFEDPWTYELPSFHPKKSGNGKSKENEPPVKEKKSAKVKGVPVEKTSKDGRPASNRSAESPSPISMWEIPSPASSKSFKSGSSSTSSSVSLDGYAELVRQTEKFTQEQLPYRLKEKETNKGADRREDHRQKAKVLPFPKYQQDLKARASSTEGVRNAVNAQVPPRIHQQQQQQQQQQKTGQVPGILNSSNVRIRQTFDPANPSTPINLLTRQHQMASPPQYPQQPINSMDQMFGIKKPEVARLPASASTGLNQYGVHQHQHHHHHHHQRKPEYQIPAWKAHATSSQQFADAMFATPTQHPPQVPEIFRPGSSITSQVERASSPRDWRTETPPTYPTTNLATWTLEELFPSTRNNTVQGRWSPAEPADTLLGGGAVARGPLGLANGGAIRDSLWDPAFVPPESPAPAAPGSLWGSMGLGFGLSSLWSSSTSSGNADLGALAANSFAGLNQTDAPSSTPPPNPVGTRPIGESNHETFGRNLSSASSTAEDSLDQDRGFNPLRSGPSIWNPTNTEHHE